MILYYKNIICEYINFVINLIFCEKYKYNYQFENEKNKEIDEKILLDK